MCVCVCGHAIILLWPRPQATHSFSMLHAEKREGLVSKITNRVHDVICGFTCKFCV